MAKRIQTEQQLNEQTSVKPVILHHEVREYGHFYLTSDIGEADEFIGLFNWLQKATEDDTMYLHINSTGGDLYTCLQIINAIRTSEATVVGMAEGACMSAASFIFLACDEQHIMPYAEFMFHDASMTSQGKAGERFEELGSFRKLYDLMIEDMYSRVLTEQEIERLKDGKDYYFLAEDMMKRLGLEEE